MITIDVEDLNEMPIEKLRDRIVDEARYLVKCSSSTSFGAFTKTWLDLVYLVKKLEEREGK